MDRLLMILGAILAVCGFCIGFKRGNENKEKPNGIIEWIVLLIGILLFVIGTNM